jgi:ABC-type lipoprotein release transport system permease subunit
LIHESMKTLSIVTVALVAIAGIVLMAVGEYMAGAWAFIAAAMTANAGRVEVQLECAVDGWADAIEAHHNSLEREKKLLEALEYAARRAEQQEAKP